MKRFLTSLLLLGWCAVSPAQVPSQLPPASNGLSFDARLVANGGAAKTERGGPVGPYTTAQSSQTRASKMSVEVRARNFSAVPAEAHLEWFFIAKDLQSKKPYVWDHSRREVSLAAGSEQKETAESTELYQATTQKSESRPVQGLIGQTPRYQQSSSKQEWGAKPYGWIVRLWSGDRLLKVQASSNDLEAMARDLDPLPKVPAAKP